MTAPGTIGRFLNAQPQVIAWLSDPDRGLPEYTMVGTRVPSDLEGVHFVWVVRRPGASGYVTTTARMEIHCFAPSEDAGWTLAAAVHTGVAALAGNVSLGQLYDKVRSVADPVEQFWSPTVFRTVAVYDLDARVVA